MPMDPTSKLVAIIDDDEAMQNSPRDFLERELQAKLKDEECEVPIIFPESRKTMTRFEGRTTLISIQANPALNAGCGRPARPDIRPR
jgi:hypothetical protein